MTKRTPRTVAAYLRISKDDETSSSIEKQRQTIETWIAANAPNASVEWFPDEGVSGSKDVKRPFRDALETRLGHFDVLAFYSADRLARSVVDLWRIVTKANEVETQIVSVTQPTIDTTTAQGRAFLGLLAIFAQLEAETTGERVRATNALRRSRGQRAVGGPAGFGFRRVDGHLRPDPEAAPLVRSAALGIADGTETLASVARGWQAKTPAPRGGEWTTRTIAKILRSPALAGFVVSNGEPVVGDDLLPIRDPDAAILTVAERDALLSALDSRRKVSARREPLPASPVDGVDVFCEHGTHRLYARRKPSAVTLEAAAATGNGSTACARSINRAALAEYLVREALDRVGADTQILALRTSPGASDERLAALRAERARLTARLAGAGAGEVGDLAARIARLADEESAEAARTDEEVIWTGETYSHAMVDAERASGVLRDLIERVRVLPGARGGRVPTADRVEIIWRTREQL